MNKQEFYENDVALWEVENTSGKSVLVPVKVISKENLFGNWRYVIEPVGGQGQTITQNLIKNK